MEYIYAAMLIHKLGGKIDESSVKKVLEAAGAKPNDARVKALVAALEGLNIDEAIKKAAIVQTVAAPTTGESPKATTEKKEEKKEEKKTAEEAAAGLSALFG